MSALFVGTLTRLVAFDPERGAELMTKWYRDSEFAQLYDFPPVQPRDRKRTEDHLLKSGFYNNPNDRFFHIETLDKNQVIGECELEVDGAAHREGYAAIGIGEREFWGKGYGSDAMRLLLGFGFLEWNLHHIALSAFEYNTRAIRSYEKVGFKVEGRIRGHLKRFGKRHDSIYMGILRAEWEANQNG